MLNVFIIVLLSFSAIFCRELTEKKYKWPTVVISVLVRNKAHTLPYFFSCLEKLDYPKDRMFIWLYSDFNEDNSISLIKKWSSNYGSGYAGINITIKDSNIHLHGDEAKPTNWSPLHFKHVIRLREEALKFSRSKWADYIFMVDADVFFTNHHALKILVGKDLPVSSPMLESGGLYSNFWCDMTENYYYKRTDIYASILNRDVTGCFDVPMVHTAVLMNLRLLLSDNLSYDPRNIINYDGPEDDIIAFAINARKHGIPFKICNDIKYGYVPVPLEDNEDLADDQEQILNVKLEAISKGLKLPLEPVFHDDVAFPKMWKYGCDEIYVINLKRRKEKRDLMKNSLLELGMEAKFFLAVDGRDLDMNNLSEFNVQLLPNYEDPYHKRPMKAGEIGCFLSHYRIWEEVIEYGYKTALVLEDDIHFVPYFRHNFLLLMSELEELDWDLVYIGRKILESSEEVFVTEHLVRPLYSYWTLGYLISQRGAKKLLDVKPLTKVLPVDEFLPIMFDQHPNATWKSMFWPRDVIALSAAPLLVYPTHYTGQEGYISDTEDSPLLTTTDENLRHHPTRAKTDL